MATWTVQPSGGDYTSLSLALSNASTAAGDTIEIRGDWTSSSDTTAATVSDDNITIRAPSGNSARHSGYDNGGANYKLAVSGSHALTVNNTGCVVDGIIIEQTGTGSSDECIRIACDNGTFRGTNLITRCANNTSDQDCIYAGQIDVTVELENVYGIGPGRAAFQAQPFSTGTGVTQTWNLISCFGWDTSRFSGEAGGGGVCTMARNSGTTVNVNAHNSIMFTASGASSDAFNIDTGLSNPGTINYQIDNCVASDSSISSRDSGAVNATESATITDGTPGAGTVVAVNDITTAPYDLRLQDDANNDAQDQHANGTGAGLTIGDYTTGDVVGTTRPQNTNYDIGPFEVSAGGTTVAVGLASDTSTALAITAAKTVAVGLATDSSTALPVTSGGTVAVGQAVDTSTALPITARKTQSVGIASDTSTALPVTVATGQTVAVGLASDTNTALPITVLKTVGVGIAIDSNIALPLIVEVPATGGGGGFWAAPDARLSKEIRRLRRERELVEQQLLDRIRAREHARPASEQTEVRFSQQAAQGVAQTNTTAALLLDELTQVQTALNRAEQEIARIRREDEDDIETMLRLM